ncbi:fluoride efflux transporter CrcB [Undibacterium fentianense]|uniref:Fluoride-specific ion channel FluC n=1 Tax=Undibacterium fentianense TaxID=2828728 RepID=A0A941E2U1_9BURK|nr:fluoride efflux transporter CrcB [Undibacterium fentianense]MBR7800022.1 fluoride efflux transporter CrcB [Undibacterium fentianense]
MGVLAVAIGAAIGACLRWILTNSFNAALPHLPLGTVFANLSGGYLIGLCVGIFSSHPELAPEWRLFIVTGFLGGLTTFSSFSAESMSLLQRGDWLWAFLHSGLHLLGSLLCCFAGFASWRFFHS